MARPGKRNRRYPLPSDGRGFDRYSGTLSYELAGDGPNALLNKKQRNQTHSSKRNVGGRVGTAGDNYVTPANMSSAIARFVASQNHGAGGVDDGSQFGRGLSAKTTGGFDTGLAANMHRLGAFDYGGGTTHPGNDQHWYDRLDPTSYAPGGRYNPNVQHASGAAQKFYQAASENDAAQKWYGAASHPQIEPSVHHKDLKTFIGSLFGGGSSSNSQQAASTWYRAAAQAAARDEWYRNARGAGAPQGRPTGVGGGFGGGSGATGKLGGLF